MPSTRAWAHCFGVRVPGRERSSEGWVTQMLWILIGFCSIAIGVVLAAKPKSIERVTDP